MADIVTSALRRSCGHRQVRLATLAEWQTMLDRQTALLIVAIDPLPGWSDLIIQTHQSHNAKVIIFGALSSSVAHHLNAVVAPLAEDYGIDARCSPAPCHSFTESALRVAYRQPVGGTTSPIPDRPFSRYDFTDEWNNLGYGAIRADGSIWAWSHLAKVQPENCIAEVTLGAAAVSAYAGLWDSPKACLLWFNRPVGPVDSQEWRLVETYLAHYRYPQLPCCPVLSEVPYGYQAGVTMRLDCDEDVESARSLWETYNTLDVPFSLAIHTSVLADTMHHVLPCDVLNKAGAILSHTATHAPDWGGSYSAALNEAITSSNAIAGVTGQPVRYAVSPFHQTPAYARTALRDAGYAGCIGGIIRNDPDFLMARAGVPPGSVAGFIGHSQQCMLHGDCMLAGDDPLVVFKQAFDIALEGRAFFGYLDHPFSARYQYGWASEGQRSQAHRDFVAYIQNHPNVLFANENDAMDFFGCRSSVNVSMLGSQYRIDAPAGLTPPWPLAVEYGGTTYALDQQGLTL